MLPKVRHLAKSGAARTIRIGAGLSLAEIGEGVGVAAATVQRWETAQRAPRGKPAIAYGRLLDGLLGRPVGPKTL